MIKTVADLLQSLAKAEAARLSEIGIRHAPTIGEMYEGLTAGLLDRALPAGANLQVVSGFVVDHDGNSSGQIDCMLVDGVGEKMPYTKHYRWPVQNVLAVFEVKKTLFGAALADGYDQLKSVSDIYSKWVQSGSDTSTVDASPTRRVYAEVTGRVLPPPDEWKDLPINLHVIFHLIWTDQLAPIRVILGYDGYKTEKGLRDGFADCLEKLVGVFGHGPSGLPTLVVAGEYSLIKLSGHPYRSPLLEDGSMPLMASSHANPLIFLLEQIWTRLSYQWPIANLFGEDLDIEKLALFLTAKPTEISDQPGRWGWMYRIVPTSEKKLSERDEFEAWEPVKLSLTQYVVIAQLTKGVKVSTADSSLKEFVESEGENFEAFIASLVATTLVALDGDKLELTTTNCTVAIVPGGDYVAADNNTGRLDRWFVKFMAERKPV